MKLLLAAVFASTTFAQSVLLTGLIPNITPTTGPQLVLVTAFALSNGKNMQLVEPVTLDTTVARGRSSATGKWVIVSTVAPTVLVPQNSGYVAMVVSTSNPLVWCIPAGDPNHYSPAAVHEDVTYTVPTGQAGAGLSYPVDSFTLLQRAATTVGSGGTSTTTPPTWSDTACGPAQPGITFFAGEFSSPGYVRTGVEVLATW